MNIFTKSLRGFYNYSIFFGTGPTSSGQPKTKSHIFILSNQLLSVLTMATFSWHRSSLISFLQLFLSLGKILELPKIISFGFCQLWSSIPRIEATRRFGLQVWPLIALLCDFSISSLHNNLLLLLLRSTLVLDFPYKILMVKNTVFFSQFH